MSARPSRTALPGHLRLGLLAIVLLSIPRVVAAQSSAGYQLTEHVFNAGGRPAQGVVSGSAGFSLSLEAIGEPIAARGLVGASFRLDAGLLPAYAPPGEVAGLQLLADGQTLTWSLEPASAVFNVYSGSISTLPGPYGACLVARVAGTTFADASMPTPGTGLFYLVTGVNRLRQEGTKGHASGGAERSNPAPCP